MAKESKSDGLKKNAFGKVLEAGKPDLSNAPIKLVRFNVSPPYGNCQKYSRGDTVAVRVGGEAWGWTEKYYDYRDDNKNDDRKPVAYAEVVEMGELVKASEEQRAKQAALLVPADGVLD